MDVTTYKLSLLSSPRHLNDRPIDSTRSIKSRTCVVTDDVLITFVWH